ncbi:MAG TPA: hypothetical protein VHG71_12905 [Verrucomicrobiae bacterium]|nr:hypothetical protein [Verrucomicrobiae bacterium]
METAILIAVGLILLPYFLNPILLRIKLRGYFEPNIIAVPVESLPPEVRSYLDSSINDFSQVGFYHCTYAKMQNYDNTGEVYISLWFHGQKGISAYPSIAYIHLPNQPVKVFAKSICFITRFSESSQYETSISGVPSPLAPNPQRPCVQLPKTMVFQELFAAHQILAEKFHPSGERMRVIKGQEFATMKRKMVEINQYQIDMGRWAFDAMPKIYHLTWRGAVINGWQHAWPIKGLRKWLLDKRAEQLRKSLSAGK